MFTKEKADFIQRKLFVIRPGFLTISLTPEEILKKATPEEIDFYYHFLMDLERQAVYETQMLEVVECQSAASRQLSSREIQEIKNKAERSYYARHAACY